MQFGFSCRSFGELYFDIVEVTIFMLINIKQINSNGAGTGKVNVEAISSTGRIIPCTIVEKNGLYTANFTPNEIGISA